jgi:membrane protein
VRPSLRLVWEVVSESWRSWRGDGATRASAALAFYALFATAPLLLVLSQLIGLLLGVEALGVEERVLEAAVSPQVADAMLAVVREAEQGGGLAVGGLGVAALAWACLRGFLHTQATLNMLWGVRARRGESFTELLKHRVPSLLAVLTTSSLMTAVALSTVASRVVAARMGWIAEDLPGVDGPLSMFALWGMLCVVYRMLPDAHIAWSDVWVGAAITAGLFALGRNVIAWYITSFGTHNVSGAASSFIIVLLFAYYASTLLLVGAKMTVVYARKVGHGVRPAAHAVRVEHQVVDDV